jgi:uncharacterized protein with ParB-like and HNH nuclease domain
MGITPHYRSVKELLQSRSFGIDEYQREYKWESANIGELVNDLLGKFQSSYRPGDEPRKAEDYADYFLGTIIVTSRGGKHFLVDGQQRVTSLTLLLIYLYRAAQTQGLPVTSTIEPLIVSDSYGERKFNLDIPERSAVMRALFVGDEVTADGQEESVRTIVARYGDIEASGLVEDLGEGLPTFIYWLIGKVGLIEIGTGSDAHAFAMFETMNDRGKPLNPIDMLKAYMLGPITDDTQRGEANRVWKQTVHDLISWGDTPDHERDGAAVKAWLRAKYARTIRDRSAGASDKDWELIGTIFHRWLRDNAAVVGVGQPERNRLLMTQEFPFFARAYRQILDASRTYIPGLEPIFYNAHNEFTWQPTVLLAPLLVGDDSDTVRRKLAATATYLDIWIMRRAVNYVRVGYSSVSYAMYLLCRDIRDQRLPDLIDTLQKKLAEDDATFEGSRVRGRHGIADLGLNQFSRRYIYHLLARLTAYVDLAAGRADGFPTYVDRSGPNPLDIEHIWASNSGLVEEFPDTKSFDEARNNIGGLLLLPADVNRSYQAKTYEEKVGQYARQNYYAASLHPSAYQHQPQFTSFIACERLPFKPYTHFGKAEQKERNALVLELANRIWSPASLDSFR